jgi:hypothetical protein
MPRKIENYRKTFIDRCRGIHGNTYDYSKTIYIRSAAKIEIICKEHGSFWQKASGHLSGQGCPKCGKEIMAKTVRHSREDSIKILQEKWPKYDFSKFIYVNNCTNSVVICPEHGEFKSSHRRLLKATSCKGCVVKSGFSRTGWSNMCNGRTSYIYIIQLKNQYESFIKIGITITPKGRYKQFKQKGFTVKQLDIIANDNPDNTFNGERDLGRKLKQHKYMPVTKFEGCHECFIDSSFVLFEFQKVKKGE